MASNSNRGNQALVPQAREALNKFKMESASEVGVTAARSRRLRRGRESAAAGNVIKNRRIIRTELSGNGWTKGDVHDIMLWYQGLT